MAGAASILAWVSVWLFIYAVRSLKVRDVALERFMPGRAQEEPLPAGPRKEREDTGRMLLLALLGMVACGGVVLAVTGLVQAALLGSLAGLAAPRLWAAWHRNGQIKLMSRQMEQALEAMSAVLRSGGGLPAALEVAARDAKPPLQAHLNQAVAESRMGIPASVVVRQLADRVGLREMENVVLAAEIQQGGMAVNLASVLNNVQSNLRERQAYAEMVSAITTENRIAGWVVAIIPFLTIGFMRTMAPDFIAPLFNTSLGLTVFAVSTAAIIGGVVWIMRLASGVGG